MLVKLPDDEMKEYFKNFEGKIQIYFEPKTEAELEGKTVPCYTLKSARWTNEVTKTD